MSGERQTLPFNPAKVFESVAVMPQTKGSLSTTESTVGMGSLPKELYVQIEAIHAGTSKNSNRYPAEKLRGDMKIRSGMYSWNYPYPKPLIYNHDTDTDATGRIIDARYAEMTQAGRPGIIVTAHVVDPKAIERVLDGRLLTVSIGATSNAAICSICGTDIIDEGFCGHMRGESYGGEVAEWITGDLWFDELSWVNVPADQDAMIVGTSLYKEGLSNNEGIESARLTVSLTPPSFLEGAQDMEQTPETTPETTPEESLSLEEQLELANAEKKRLEEEKNALTLENQQLKKEQEGLEEAVTEEIPAEETSSETPVEPTLEEATATDTPATEAVVEEATTVSEEATSTSVEEEVIETELDPAMVALQTEVDSLKEQLETAKEEISVLEASNLELVDELKTTVVEHLAYIALSQDKDVTNMTEGRAKYATRTIESLKDTFKDLSEKTRTLTVFKQPELEDQTNSLRESVANPTAPASTPTLAEASSKQIDGHDYLVNLLRSTR